MPCKGSVVGNNIDSRAQRGAAKQLATQPWCRGGISGPHPDAGCKGADWHSGDTQRARLSCFRATILDT